MSPRCLVMLLLMICLALTFGSYFNLPTSDSSCCALVLVLIYTYMYTVFQVGAVRTCQRLAARCHALLDSAQSDADLGGGLYSGIGGEGANRGGANSPLFVSRASELSAVASVIARLRVCTHSTPMRKVSTLNLNQGSSTNSKPSSVANSNSNLYSFSSIPLSFARPFTYMFPCFSR